jgi:hypothetical protein
MLETENKELSFSDIASKLREWFVCLRKQFWKLLFLSVLGGISALVYAHFAPIAYKSKVSFVVEEGKAGAGGLASLAGQFGIDISGSGGTGLISGDNIILFLKSKSLVKEILMTQYDSSNNYSLADRYADVYKLRKKWANSSEVGKEIFFPPVSSVASPIYTRLQDSLMHIMIDKVVKKQLIVERPEKKATFINLEASFRDEKLGALFSSRLVDSAINIYIVTKTKRQKTNVDKLKRRADSIATALNRQTYQTASNQEKIIDINPAERVVTVKTEVSMRDKMMLTTIYGEVVKNLEIAKVQLNQETPTIQLVDIPEYPLENDKKSKSVYIIIGFFLFFFLGSVYFLLKRQ